MPGTAVLHCEWGSPRCRGNRTHAIFPKVVSGFSVSECQSGYHLLCRFVDCDSALLFCCHGSETCVSPKKKREHDLMTVAAGFLKASHRRCRRIETSQRLYMPKSINNQQPKGMHSPGIEPGSGPWQGPILPLDQECSSLHMLSLSIFWLTCTGQTILVSRLQGDSLACMHSLSAWPS